MGEKADRKEKAEMYFRVCPHCGCALDPSERCDCQQERRSKEEMSKNGGNEGKWNVEEVETEE